MNQLPQPAILRTLTNALLNQIIPTLKEPVQIRVDVTEGTTRAISGWDAYHREWTAQILWPDRIETWALHLSRRDWLLKKREPIPPRGRS